MSTPAPSEDQVNAIAAYVEAARELRNEPFFHKDESRSISVQGNCFSFQVGSRFHFRSALVTFRRLWMNDEPSHFFYCYNILRQFTPEAMHPMLQSWRESVQEIRTAKAFSGILLKNDDPLTNEDLINLWLNAVFAHVSLKGDKKRLSFESYLQQYGHGVLEYAFRMAVWSLGIEYQNMSNIHAEPLLRRWKEQGIKPSFEIGAPFGVFIQETTPQGHVIVRKGSSKFHNEESVEQMVARICSRSENGNLNSVLKFLGLSQQATARLVFGAESIEDIIKGANRVLELVEEASPDMVHTRTGVRSQATLFEPSSGKKSAILFQENLVITDTTGIAVLNQSLAAVKDQLRLDVKEAS